jgi:CubicO group peptidase (beta-lactamase class C family)
MLKRLLLLIAFVALPASAGVIPDRIATAVADRIAAGELPSAVVAMIVDGKTEIRGFGALADGKAPDADTLFEIGSISKTFTATLLAEAAVKGEVKIDEPLRDLLPTFAIPSHDGREITLADIAEQHSGLPRMPDNFRPKDPGDPFADYSSAKLKEFLAGYTLPRTPGASYEYSNLAVGLLGYALAEQRHTSYGELVATRIFKPLGMTSSAVSLTPALRARLAAGFDGQGKPARPWAFDALAGCGGIRSSAADMLRYVEAYMGRTKTPLRAAMDLAIAPRRPLGDQKIGLIWMRLPLHDGGTLVWHNGMTGGYASFAGFTADGRKGVVILTNQAQTLDDLGIGALDDAAPLTPAHKAVALTETQLRRFAGTYKIFDKFFLTLIAGKEQLFARATGQGQFPLFASSGTEFFAKLADISIRFTDDGLMLRQNGVDYQGTRIADRDAAAELGAISVDPATLSAYAGSYALEGPRKLAIDISVTQGQLMARALVQEAYPLFASAPDAFFYLAVDTRIEFQRDETGAVTGLILHQGGRALTAKRISAP